MMSNDDTKNAKTILVTGATGQQGGATARHLITKGFRVRAFTRDANKPAARDLAERGADVIQGDLDDRSSLDRAIDGADGVFSVGNFWEGGRDAEVRHGEAVADAAKAAGVKHLVYTSVDGAERATGLAHFDSKFEVEQIVAAAGVPATILRPVFFMDNFLTLFRPKLEGGELSFAIAMRPDKPLQMIATHDIGAVAALAFERPGAFIGKTVGLAGDALTMPQVADAMTSFLGRPVRFIEVPVDAVRAMSRELGDMFAWFNDVGYTVDIAGLREIHPGLLRFGTWLSEVNFGAGSAFGDAGKAPAVGS